MLSKADIKYIKSLQVKKYRKQEQSFVVQGAKSVLELLASDFEVAQVFGTGQFLSGLNANNKVRLSEVTEKELDGVGEFQTNNAALAIARIKPNLPIAAGPKEFVLVLDDIRDP